VLLAEIVIAVSAWKRRVRRWRARPRRGAAQHRGAGGELLYSRYLLPFELAGLILLVAMIGAIVLTHRSRGDARGQNAPPDRPPPRGCGAQHAARRRGDRAVIGLAHYLTVAAILFVIGVLGIFLNRRNVILMLMAIELILLSVNINLVAFSAYLGDLKGQVFAMFVLTVAAAEAAIGLRSWSSSSAAAAPSRSTPPTGCAANMQSIILIVFLPLLAALIAGLGGRVIGKVPAKVITTGALFVSCALSWPIFLGFLSGRTREATVVPVLDWIRSGDLQVDWALRVDTLTAVMLVVVTTVSSLVHLYSWGYMDEDPSQPRFFAYLSLFTFAMLMLVTADSLVQMFFGWEGVGLASYLLIGFWYHKPSPTPRRSRRSWSTASATSASASASSAPSWCSAPSRSRRSSPRRRAWPARPSALPACGSTP
jgi:NADH:ubiquinone oxidoreductase subunit K